MRGGRDAPRAGPHPRVRRIGNQSSSAPPNGLRTGDGLATRPIGTARQARYCAQWASSPSSPPARRRPTRAWASCSRRVEAVTRLRAGDVALGRLDVLPSLDGIEAGWWALETLERRGVIVLNDGPSLARAHDKLATAHALAAAGVAHPAHRARRAVAAAGRSSSRRSCSSRASEAGAATSSAATRPHDARRTRSRTHAGASGSTRPAACSSSSCRRSATTCA